MLERPTPEAADASSETVDDALVQQLHWGLHRITLPKRRGAAARPVSLVPPVEARGVALSLRETVRRLCDPRDRRELSEALGADPSRGHLFFATRADLREHLAGLCGGAFADGASLREVLRALDAAIARFEAENPELPPRPRLPDEPAPRAG